MTNLSLCVALTLAATTPAEVETSAVARQARAAVERAIPAIEQGLEVFHQTKPRVKPFPNCASCHHEGVGLTTFRFLKDRGFAVDSALAESQVESIERLLEFARPGYEKAARGDAEAKIQSDPFGDVAVMVGYLVGGVADYRGDRLSDAATAAVRVLPTYQMPDGRWTYRNERGPLQADDVTTTALAVRLLRAQVASSDRRDSASATALDRAMAWLDAAKPAGAVARAYRVLGLRWGGADDRAVRAAAEVVLKSQATDGGWGDIYATSLSLVALNRAGVPADDTAFRRGVAFLLARQASDGTWHVAKTAPSIQKYFDAGFPYGQDQYISLPATCWAVMALSLAADMPR